MRLRVPFQDLKNFYKTFHSKFCDPRVFNLNGTQNATKKNSQACIFLKKQYQGFFVLIKGVPKKFNIQIVCSSALQFSLRSKILYQNVSL